MKPDWATRLQRTFARKYDAGFAKGLMLGKAVATRDEQERIIELLEEARDKCACYRQVGMPICRHQLSVDEQIALIKGEK